jgi:RimJ/RimL family protein N-acetyltransferase
MARRSLPTRARHTARRCLRPFSSANADCLFALHSNAQELRYWDAPPWTELERAERFITACRQMAEQGSGARPAIERASDGAFLGWWGLTRWTVQAETDTRNVASLRVLEKLGFLREGTLREDCCVNGEVSDSWVYGLLRRQWRPSSQD